MENKVYTYYKELPQWAKGVVIVGVLGATYILISQTIKRFRDAADIRAAMEESNLAAEELKKLQAQGVNPTLTSLQIDVIIKSLEDAMNDCGTNEERVYDAFKKLNNQADLTLLVKNWAVRYYRPCAASEPISFGKYLWDNKSFGGGISTWLNFDLDASEIKKVNKILSDKRIDFQF